MHKADLLDEVRADIGLASDKLGQDIGRLYQIAGEIMYQKVPAYQSVAVYLSNRTQFECVFQEGYSPYPPVIRFGEGLHSLAAVRGSVVREKVGVNIEIYVPFYHGHHLVGELVVMGEEFGSIDEEDVALFSEVASLFETKVKDAIRDEG
ncbi:hypothetical protein [Mechercharimyces sp. CAU 1602]|uniref:hypothetical protein n=1 Tax=Mechercharimyces sp. CAU 1602 TaxID=2973933 RepID=UPI002162A48C|nr:hypothetical protein [Mechercharimyces sp. CAU 1602]MCS1350569.1 hypothetical protein [Mechercharimyces sp. CAU 1602]